jgi:ATP-dependent helicase HrpB
VTALTAPLPIDDALPALVDAVRARGVAVLVAPPGAGKTTRVPGALLDAGLAGDGDVIVLEPRRLATRLAATRVAAERGAARKGAGGSSGRLGDEVGYEIRFDRQVGSATRIRFVTEGVFTRRITADPQLRGTGCVVVDEFHERHLDGDLALALLARLRRTTRPDLRVVVMSATLEAEALAAYLDAPIVRSEGRAFPVDVEYATEPDDRPLARQVAGAVRRLVQGGLDGHVLAFLPGAAEIGRTHAELAELAQHHDLALHTLHGDLPAAEQDAAVNASGRRKIVLSTNVAETSVTIDGVVAVIDTGVARIARHSAWTGMPSLQIEPISRASAAQRAGRAGRTRAGRCVRLYTKHDHDLRRAFDAPEVARADLAGVVLELAGAGIRIDDIAWLDPPPAQAVAAATRLVERLGGIDAAGAITPLGRRMLRFPAHPRAARVIAEAEERGVGREGAVIAALLGARELRLQRLGGAKAFGPGAGPRLASPSDLIDDLDVLLVHRKSGLRADRLARDGVDVATAFAVDRAARQLEGLCDRRTRGPDSADEVDAALRLAILTGFPDRVGRRRAPRSAEIVLAGGGSGTQAPSSSVIDAPLVVVVDAAETGERGKGGRVSIRRASAIEPSWLLDLYLDRVADTDELVWNAERQRVERATRMSYDGLVFDEQLDVEGARRRPEEAAAVLAREAIAAGIERFVDADGLAQWRARVGFAAGLVGPDAGLAPPTDAGLAAAVAGACAGLVSFAELRKVPLLDLLDGSLGAARALVDRLAPTHLPLPGRRRAPIHYELDRPPWIASRMQDFFGLARAPTVGDGRVPLVIHLLAPNQRPVQVTTDLPGFWVKHYPAIRKELMRKYPRHKWPEDPASFIAED